MYCQNDCLEQFVRGSGFAFRFRVQNIRSSDGVGGRRRPQETIFEVHDGWQATSHCCAPTSRSRIACGGGATAIRADVQGKGGHEVCEPAVALLDSEFRHDERVLQAPPG